MNTVSHKYRQSALLLLTAAIWGSSFVAQQTGMDYVGPFTFNAARSLLGGLALLPLIAFFSSREKRCSAQQASADHTADRKTLWTGGILCGIVLFAASTLQQVGIQYTTVGKAGFITALYIVLVPVCGLFSVPAFAVFAPPKTTVQYILPLLPHQELQLPKTGVLHFQPDTGFSIKAPALPQKEQFCYHSFALTALLP